MGSGKNFGTSLCSLGVLWCSVHTLLPPILSESNDYRMDQDIEWDIDELRWRFHAKMQLILLEEGAKEEAAITKPYFKWHK